MLFVLHANYNLTVTFPDHQPLNRLRQNDSRFRLRNFRKSDKSQPNEKQRFLGAVPFKFYCDQIMRNEAIAA